jgi:hypothetical protein
VLDSNPIRRLPELIGTAVHLHKGRPIADVGAAAAAGAPGFGTCACAGEARHGEQKQD